jgi:uncharacterized membrane protein YidH (DUF202 family)
MKTFDYLHHSSSDNDRIQQVSKVIEKLARFGYAVKGIVYGLIGILAVQAAFTAGGKTTGSKGALHTIAAQPFGSFLLILIAIGLLGYVIWRFVQAINDPEHQKTNTKRVVARIGYAISGILYLGLAASAVQIVLNVGGGGGGNSTQTWTARLLGQPFGRWLVGLVGALVIGVGFYRLYRAYTIEFRKNLNLSEMSPQQEVWAVRISRLGITARGIVFVLIGFFLIQAAKQFNPNQAKGLDGVLLEIAQRPHGQILLALVAIGLVAYGIYMLVQARYRRIRTT